jgi:type IV pilus assembly protein PilC
VPLLKSLEVVCAQVESRRLLLALDDVRRDVQAGSSLKDAMAKHRMVFSKLWLNLIGTGESSGHLSQSLWQLERHFESSRRLQGAALTALTYPAVLFCAITIVLAVFVYFIIPKFTAVFVQSGMSLPLLTRFVVGLSNVARHYWVVVLFGVFGVIYGLRYYVRTTVGQWMRDRLLLVLPILGRLFMDVQLAEFAHGFSTLLESGVPLLTTLDILEDSATNKLYGQAIGQVRDAVKMGKSISQTMDEVPSLFPPMVVQMMLVGEEVGALSKMSSRIATYYTQRVEFFIARLSRLFEPVMIIIMAVVIGIVVISIYLPLFRIVGGS